MTSYLDTSGSHGEVVVAAAALIASPTTWVEFDRRWNDVLEAHQVTYLHMTDLERFKGSFEGWDIPRRKRFLNALMWIIEDLVDWTAVCAVYLDDYRYLDREYQLSEVMRPYSLANLISAHYLFAWADKQGHHRKDLTWVFEKGDQDQNDLSKRWNIAYPEADVSPIFLRKKDAYPDRKSIGYIRPFEAADLIAYEHQKAHRLLNTKRGADTYEDELRRELIRMKDTWPSAKEWGVCDQRSLEELCTRLKIPKRHPLTS
jgi:hypothetical protein